MISNTDTPLQKLKICLEILIDRKHKTPGETAIFLLTEAIKELKEEKKQRLERMIIK